MLIMILETIAKKYGGEEGNLRRKRINQKSEVEEIQEKENREQNK